jgi:preprotein translocase subunit SecG
MMMFSLFLVCVLLMLVVLIQKGRGGGLAGAFGGGGGAGSAFGAKTGDVFTGITVGLAAVYLLLTVCGNYVMRPPAGAAIGVNVAGAGALPPAAPASPEEGAAPATTPDDLTGGAAPLPETAPVATTQPEAPANTGNTSADEPADGGDDAGGES